jgi:hypothetical protein
MPASITLKRTVRKSDPALYQGYAMIVEVTNAVDVAEEIFVIQRKVAPSVSADNDEMTDRFVKVASPVDLQNYPPSPTEFSEDIHFYRVQAVELWFRNEEERDDTWELLQEDVKGLVNFLNNHLDADFTETEEITL